MNSLEKVQKFTKSLTRGVRAEQLVCDVLIRAIQTNDSIWVATCSPSRKPKSRAGAIMVFATRFPKEGAHPDEFWKVEIPSDLVYEFLVCMGRYQRFSDMDRFPQQRLIRSTHLGLGAGVSFSVMLNPTSSISNKEKTLTRLRQKVRAEIGLSPS